MVKGLTIKDVLRDRKDATAFLQQLHKEWSELTGEEISELQVSLIVDHFFKRVGPLLYNKGVDDCSAFLLERFEALVDDVAALKQSER